MKAVIVDDEAHIIKTLKFYLSSHPLVEVVGTANDIAQAIATINAQKPDILFLDIELKSGLSFEIFKQLHHSDYKIVFVTAHEQYAIQAIRYAAFDYLLKPVCPEKLDEVVNRLSTEQENTNMEVRLTALENNLLEKHPPQRLVLKTAEKYNVIHQNDVIRLEADNTYTLFYLTNNRKIIISHPIKYYEDLLSPCQFFRPHRSHIINIEQVNEYIKSDGGYIVMSNGDSVPISGNKKVEFLKLLES